MKSIHKVFITMALALTLVSCGDDNVVNDATTQLVNETKTVVFYAETTIDAADKAVGMAQDGCFSVVGIAQQSQSTGCN